MALGLDDHMVASKKSFVKQPMIACVELALRCKTKF